jgi:TetR/AcrR family transcriptional regulator, transcriptional repressor for nem operon
VARPKEFDRATALKAAIAVFSDHGYEGTSTDALLEAMGICRQSMYDTFGDKRRLYLDALQQYNADSIAEVIANLNMASSPLTGLEAALIAFASRPAHQSGLGCMGVASICEFGRSDPEVALLNEAAARTLHSAFERRVAEAKAAGEVAGDLDVRTAAEFIQATLAGIKVAARSGAAAETLKGIARLALRSLR